MARSTRTQALPSPVPPVTKAEAEALKQFEAAAGGRLALIQRLSYVDERKLSSEHETLLSMLLDPVCERESLAVICKRAGFSVGRFLAFLKEARGAQALLESYEKIYAALPEVVEDVMNQAKPQKVPCLPCGGIGKVKELTAFKGKREGQKAKVKKLCKECHGEGFTVIKPGVERHRLALELGGLGAQRGAGVTVQVSQSQQQAQAAPYSPSMLSSFQAASDKVLFGGVEIQAVEYKPLPDPVDIVSILPAEVLPSHEPAPVLAPAFSRPTK